MRTAEPLAESVRRVITLLYKHGPQSKGELARKGHMGWATVVKAINHLMDEDIVESTGSTRRVTPRQGKHAHLYSLTPDNPLAIGVDVEVRTTRVVLASLAGRTIAQATYRTPQEVDDQQTRRFFEESIQDFVSSNNINMDDLDGIGVGFPSIGFPTSSTRDNIEKARRLEKDLSNFFGTVVRFEINTKAYAVFEKWRNEGFAYTDFIFVSIRTGVGTGIFYQGNLYRGIHGLSGEIGHIKAVPDGPPCRCGNSGCIVPVVNQQFLYQQYRAHVLKDAGWSRRSTESALFEGLADLFTRARNGEPAARSILDTAASYLGFCIANAIIVMDINNVILSGHFGPDGDAIIQPIREVVRENLMPGVSFNIDYQPFDPNGHTHGASLLVLNDYFVDIPEQFHAAHGDGA